MLDNAIYIDVCPRKYNFIWSISKSPTKKVGDNLEKIYTQKKRNDIQNQKNVETTSTWHHKKGGK